ncbi:MAG: hypothetical protein WBL27_07955 [Salinimicrobium sp.]
MKKLSILSLLVVFCFNLLGFYIFFGIQLFQVKNQVLRKISEGFQQEEMIKLRITSEENELLEFDGGKEFYFKGAMYDRLKKQRLSDGSIELSCYLDVEETALLKAFSGLLKTGRENHKKKNSGLKSFFKVFPKFNREHEDLKVAFLKPLKKGIFGRSYFYAAPRLITESPPPRQV